MKETTMKDDLGDRMKLYESHDETILDISMPIVIRIDGKRFSKFTSKMKKPFDNDMTELMIKTTASLIKETHAHVAYTQSDEITLVFMPKDGRTNIMFEGRVQKTTSVFASMTSAFFIRHGARFIDDKSTPFFDCRMFNVPNINEVSNSLVWRIADARRNSVSSAYRYTLGHSKMQNLSVTEMSSELESTQHPLSSYDPKFRFGTIMTRVTADISAPDSFEEILRTTIRAQPANIFLSSMHSDRVKFLENAVNKL